MKSLGTRIFVGPRWYQQGGYQLLLAMICAFLAVAILSAAGCW